ncbi:Holliday junction resolvase RuvX [Parahaliea mediterranea]|uniref:Holliday junction resolvase RuvX n=1 Tax=Parahaliea mediterranea TaxID=651086 RepID=UPI003BA91B87
MPRTPPQTAMAFDYGLRQIGVATGNCLLGTSQPLVVLNARDGVPNWDDIGRLLQEWQPDVLVVGLPLNMDGSASELSQRAEKFARRLHGRFGLPVEMADERLSSFEAKSQQRERGHRGDYKASPVDSQAAELILRTWLAERAG